MIMRNYVISLTTAEDRRIHIKQEFGKQGIDFEFFDAITPAMLDDALQKFSLAFTDSPLTLGERACFMSHFALWYQLAQSEHSFFAIFEDDVLLGENAHLLLRSNWLPPDSIVKLEAYFKWIDVGATKLPAFDGRVLRPLLTKHVGAAGYIISRKKAQEYIAHCQSAPVSLPVDDLIFSGLDPEVFQLCPVICVQTDRASEFNIKTVQFDSSLAQMRNLRFAKESALVQQKPTLPAKILRELIRPFRQCYQFLRAQSKNRMRFR